MRRREWQGGQSSARCDRCATKLPLPTPGGGQRTGRPASVNVLLPFAIPGRTRADGGHRGVVLRAREESWSEALYYIQNTADAGIGTETERRFLIGLNCDWTVKADLEIGAPVSPFNPARPFYPHYHRCSDIKAILVTTNRKEKEWKAWKRTDGRVYQQHQERFHAGTGHHRSQMCNSVTMCNGSKSHKPFSINMCNGVTGVPHLTWVQG
jgi:hypothetical protein